MTPDVDVAVVGAGAAGLAAAHVLQRAGRSVCVFEAGPRPGGVMRTGTAEGFTFDLGPNSFRMTGAVRQLFEGVGLAAAIEQASPESHARYLLQADGLVPVPLGALGLLRTPLLSGAAKRRLLREPFVPRGDGAAESVAAFAGRRLGPELVEKLLAPFLVGVYAGDETQLGAAAAFPALVEYERTGGSIAMGAMRTALRRSDAPKGRRGSFSGRGGVGALAGELAAALGTDAIACDTRVDAIEPDDGGWRVQTGAQTTRAVAVVLAADAPAAAALLGPLAPDAAARCAEVAYAPMVSMPLAVDPAAAKRPIAGFGFLVPDAAGLKLLGGLFMSRLFEGRAPEGQELVHAMIGGLRWPEAVEQDDAALVDAVHRGLDRALGTGDAPRPLAIARWPRAVPQPDRVHPQRVAAIRAAVRALPPLELAGGWLDGVALSSAFASGLAAADRLAARR